MNADELKLASLTGGPVPTRKAEVGDLIAEHLEGNRLRTAWQSLDELQKAAVAAVVHWHGTQFPAARFQAKYGVRRAGALSTPTAATSVPFISSSTRRRRRPLRRHGARRPRAQWVPLVGPDQTAAPGEQCGHRPRARRGALPRAGGRRPLERQDRWHYPRASASAVLRSAAPLHRACVISARASAWRVTASLRPAQARRALPCARATTCELHARGRARLLHQ